MNLLFLGHGKLAKAIAQEAEDRGHGIVAFFDSHRQLATEDLNEGVDLVVETALADGLVERATCVLESGKPLLIGTTGWYSRMNEVQEICSRNNGSVLWASNFAPGVQVFRSLAVEATKRLSTLPGFRVELHEFHHLQKKDQPSGTAVHTAMDLLEVRPDWSGWIHGESLVSAGKEFQGPQTELPIFSHRTENEVGTHTLRLMGPFESLEWTHRALDRQAFGWGAVSAAEWLLGRPGWYSIDDFYRDWWALAK